MEKIRTTNDVIEIDRRKKVDRISILIHPRWVDNLGEWLKEFVWQNIKNIMKVIIFKNKTMEKE